MPQVAFWESLLGRGPGPGELILSSLVGRTGGTTVCGDRNLLTDPLVREMRPPSIVYCTTGRKCDTKLATIRLVGTSLLGKELMGGRVKR
jgi:hypothetical protein